MIADVSWLRTQITPELEHRALGAYLGFAVGDALGATVEFMTAREIAATQGVHRQLTGGGWLRLKPGQVTDDTQMCLALGRALLARDEFELHTVAEAFAAWMRSRPVDIGHTCRRGIRRYLLDGSLSAPPSDDSGGNGAAMRNLPVALATLDDDDAFEAHSLAQARFTHHHPLSDAATLVLGRMTQELVCTGRRGAACAQADAFVAAHPVFRFQPWPGNTSGYVVDTTQTVLEAFFVTTNFEDCVVRAVNRGGDADTAGALAGQLAGALYGVDAIPPRWLKRLDRAVHDEIRAQTIALLARGAATSSSPTFPRAESATRMSPLR